VSTEDKCASLREKLMEDHARKIAFFLGKCESPIEQLLLLGLLSPEREDSSIPRPDFLPEWWQCTGDDGTEYVDGGSLFELLYGAGWCSAGHDAGIQKSRGILTGERYGRDMQALFIQPELSLDGRSVRLDFAIIGEGFRIALEADGHDFHERTKAQALKDRSKDRALQRHGWVVMRFTGSEIHADAIACAKAVAEQMAVMELRLRLAETIEYRKQRLELE